MDWATQGLKSLVKAEVGTTSMASLTGLSSSLRIWEKVPWEGCEQDSCSSAWRCRKTSLGLWGMD